MNWLRRNNPGGWPLIVGFGGFLALILLIEYGFGIAIEMDAFILTGMGVVMVVLAVLLTTTIYALIITRRAYAQYRTHTQHQPYTDVTESAGDPPTKLAERMEALRSLDFEPFAVLDTNAQRDSAQMLWYYSDPSYTVRVYGGLVPPGEHPAVGFISVLNESIVIETAYRTPIQMTTPTLIVRNVTTSLEAAYDFHQQQVARYTTIHGDPTPMPTVEALIAFSERFRQQHYPLIYQDRIEKQQRYLIFVLIGLAGFGSSMLFAPYLNLLVAMPLVGILLGVMYEALNLKEVSASYSSIEATNKKKNS